MKTLENPINILLKWTIKGYLHRKPPLFGSPRHPAVPPGLHRSGLALLSEGRSFAAPLPEAFGALLQESAFGTMTWGVGM